MEKFNPGITTGLGSCPFPLLLVGLFPFTTAHYADVQRTKPNISTLWCAWLLEAQKVGAYKMHHQTPVEPSTDARTEHAFQNVGRSFEV